jgi:hypothetical protein
MSNHATPLHRFDEQSRQADAREGVVPMPSHPSDEWWAYWDGLMAADPRDLENVRRWLARLREQNEKETEGGAP